MRLKEKILYLRKQGNCYNKIAGVLGCAKSTVSYHCKKEGLSYIGKVKNTPPTENEKKRMQELYNKLGSCKKVGNIIGYSKITVSKYVKLKGNYSKEEIKKRRVKQVINTRKKYKRKLINYHGGKCVLCGYNKCQNALQFHHIDPSNKKFNISGSSYGYETLLKESKKCILVCSNCHFEVHAGVISIKNMGQPMVGKRLPKP